MTPYTTPPGKDERRVPFPSNYTDEEVEAMEKAGIYFTDWNGYTAMCGPGYTTDFLDEIKAKLNNNRAAMVMTTGPPGEGKTYFALRMAQMFDKKFDVNKQVCFTRLSIINILSNKVKLSRGQSCIIDEGHMSAGSRKWGQSEQQDLIELLAAVRSKGLLVFIIALHAKMLDLVLRKYTGTYQLGMEKPGHATPYRLFTPRFQTETWKNKYDPLFMAIPDAEVCDNPDCLECGLWEKNECHTIRAVYERNKKAFLEGVAKAVEDRMENLLRIEKRPAKNILIPLIYENHREKILYNNHKKIDWDSVKDIIEEMGWAASEKFCRSVAKGLQSKHPDLRPT